MSGGEVYTFGCNDEGALGRDTSEDDSETTPAKLSCTMEFVQISAGDSHTVSMSSCLLCRCVAVVIMSAASMRRHRNHVLQHNLSAGDVDIRRSNLCLRNIPGRQRLNRSDRIWASEESCTYPMRETSQEDSIWLRSLASTSHRWHCFLSRYIHKMTF